MKNVAIVGFGVVGAGVGELLVSNGEIIEKRAKEKINLKYICDLRDFPDSEFNKIRVDDYNIVVNDPEVDIVIETMGGCGVAYALAKKALSLGKSVVTSNKELVATHGIELMRLAKENNCKYMFEASVGGAIPVLRPIAQCLAANNITKIAGILNGTTNYILTQMYTHGKTYEEALSEAQALGYAERNPDADVKGKDTCRKICILAAIMSGYLLDPESVSTEGIASITSDDVTAAESCGGKLKLLGVAQSTENGVYACVAPYFVPENSPLYSIEDVFNGILVSGDAAGDVMFYGRGAGKLPTASAVVADVIDITMHRADENPFLLWDKAEKTPDKNAIKTRYLITASGDINTVQATGIQVKLEDSMFCFISHEMSEDELEEYKAKLKSTGIDVISSYRVFD